MKAKDRIAELVRLVEGDPASIDKDYNGSWVYRETHGELDIIITDSDSYDCPWVDIYHFQAGPVALYRVTDNTKAAKLIEEYKEDFGVRKAPVSN